MEALGITPEQATDELAYASIREWDSVAHMSLVAVLEDTFDITLETEDILGMSSLGVAREILARYGVSS